VGHGKVPAKETARASGLALAASRKKTGALGKKTGTLGEEDGNSPRASQKRPCVPKLRIPYVYYHPESYLTPVLCNIPTAATRPSLLPRGLHHLSYALSAKDASPFSEDLQVAMGMALEGGEVNACRERGVLFTAKSATTPFP
jgi:hypothetical protein